MAYRPPRSVERELRNQLRYYIRDVKHLVDTGLMWESVELEVFIQDNGTMIMNIYSTDYLKYHWDEEKLYKFPDEQSINRAYMGWVHYMVKKDPFVNWKSMTGKIVFNLED